MTEAQWQRRVLDLAQLCGWRVAHFRPARTATGWRTAVEADGVGYPDLTMVRDGRLLFAELKSEAGFGGGWVWRHPTEESAKGPKGPALRDLDSSDSSQDSSVTATRCSACGFPIDEALGAVTVHPTCGAA